MAKKRDRLSKNLLQMKFMQRSNVCDENKGEDDNLLKSAIESSGKEVFVFQDGFEFCANLRFGRMSFKGMNVDIERVMKENTNEDEIEREEVDVTREQMTKRMLTDSEINDIERTSKRRNKRVKYIRPVDDN